MQSVLISNTYNKPRAEGGTSSLKKKNIRHTNIRVKTQSKRSNDCFLKIKVNQFISVQSALKEGIQYKNEATNNISDHWNNSVVPVVIDN